MDEWTLDYKSGLIFIAPNFKGAYTPEEMIDYLTELQAENEILKAENKVLVKKLTHELSENERLRYVIKTVLEHWEKDPVMRAHTELGKMMLDAMKEGEWWPVCIRF